MFGSIRKDIKRIVALLLTVVMIIPMDVTVFADDYPKWEHDGCTQLTAHRSDYYQSYYNEDESKPIPYDYEHVKDNTFGYYLNKCRSFRVGKYCAASNSEWTDYSWIKTNDLLYEEGNENTPLTSFVVDTSVTTSEYSKNIYNTVKNWTELSLFSNVTALTIKGVQHIEAIAFPTGIKKLTIQNCQFDGALDLSSYTTLEELVITGTTLNGGTITGLNTLTNLKKLTLDGTNITSVSLASEGVASEGLEISANSCTALTSVNTGNYMLINNPSFRACSNLEILTVKGIADKALTKDENGKITNPGQTLNVNGCIKLAKLTVSYKFTDSNYRLLVEATNVVPPLGAEKSANFSRIDESDPNAPKGLFILNGFTGTYLKTYYDGMDGENPDVFDRDYCTFVDSYASYVIFQQDAEGYDKMGVKFWDSSDASKIRSYEANPIVLHVGESIVDDTPHFFASNGTNMDNLYLPSGEYGYSVSVFDGKSGDGSRGEKNGQRPLDSEMSEAQRASYNSDGVIKYEKSSNGALKVTAKNPGVAYLKVTTNDGQSRSEEQKIIVVDTIASMTIEEGTYSSAGACDGADVSTDGRADTHVFYATYTTTYPSLSAYTIEEPAWYLYKKNSSGTYESISTDTTGISINTSPAKDTSSTLGDKSLKRGYELIIKENAEGGEYSIRGSVYSGNCTTKSWVSYNAATAAGTDPYKFSLRNFSASGSELAYNGFTIDSSSSFTTTEIDFTVTGYTGQYSTPSIIGNANDCLTITKDPSNSGKYKLKFNTAKSSADIAKFLNAKGTGSNCYVDVKATLGDKTYTKRVYLASKFTVSYNSKGGSPSENITEYYLPYWYAPTGKPTKYYFDRDLNLKPVTKDGFEFMGWYDAESGGNKITRITSGEHSFGNLTLYAHWSIQHKITYNLGGGSNNASNPATFGEESENITLRDPSRSGYEFIGWTGSNGATPQKNVVIPTGTKVDMAYTANWKENDSGEESNNNSSNPAPAPAPVVKPTTPTVPTYVEPGKTAVFEVKRENPDGTSTTVEVCMDGSVRETTELPASVVAGLNATLNPLAPTIISNVELVVEKDSTAANSKIEKVSTVVVAKTINGNINLSPEMVSTLQSTATSKVKSSNVKNIDVKVNTTAADGKPLSVVVPLSSLKNNTTLKAYARDPITGGYIMLNVPLVQYSSTTGLTTNGLVSGLEYHYVSTKETTTIENNIINSIKVSNAFANTPTVAPGSVLEMRQAISPVFHMANAAKVTYSISGTGAVINPDSGYLVFTQGAKKGTYVVTIKILLTNGKTKTIKVKMKI